MLAQFSAAMQSLVGKRVRLTTPMNDPNPIEVGTMGEVYNIGFDVVNVKWDNGRQLGLIMGQDQFELVEDMFEKWDELPQEVQDVLAKHQNDDETYSNCEELKKDLHKVGYTCNYGLDGVPYDLNKI
jgi:hypothetical protein